MYCGGPHLASITISQHKIMREYIKSFGEIYDVSRIFLYIEKGGSSTTFKVPYAYVKEFPFLLLNVYQSTQENAREREEISKKPPLLWHVVSVFTESPLF